MRVASFRSLVLALLVASFAGPRSGSGAAPGAVQQVGLTIPNLMGYWPLDETALGTAADLSGNANTGTHSNNPTISTAVAPVPAGNQRSLLLTTGNDLVQIPDSASLSVGGAFTLSAWINTNATLPSANQQGILEKFEYNGTQFVNGFTFRLTTNGYLSFSVLDAVGPPFGITTAPRVVPLSAWVHVAGVYDPALASQNLKTYVNGALDPSTGNYTNPPGNGASNMHIGADYGSNQFSGNIDEARVYNRALTLEEVNVLRTGQPAPTNLMLTPAPGSITVSWTAPAPQPNVTVTYTVQRAPAGAGPWTTVASAIPYGTPTYNDNGLTFGQTYFYRVFAISVMESVPLGPQSASPLSNIPRPPSDNDEGLWGDKCSCGTSMAPAPGLFLGCASLAAFLMLALRRR